MTGFWVATGYWVIESACGGGLILLLAWTAAKFLRQPVRRQRVGESAMLAALLFLALSFGPKWLVLPLPLGFKTSMPALAQVTGPANHASSIGTVDEGEPVRRIDQAFIVLEAECESLRATESALTELPVEPSGGLELVTSGNKAILPATYPTAASESAPVGLESQALLPLGGPDHLMKALPRHAAGLPPGGRESQVSNLPHLWHQLLAFLGLANVLIAALLLARLLLAHLGLRRLLRSAQPAPLAARRLLRVLSRGSPVKPRLLVSTRLRVPLSCGLLRPTILLPAGLVERDAPRDMRWILRHELTHLERRDAWSCLWFGLGHVFYFYLPWFWWLRRQVRLCQEYVADATVAGLAPVEDYAEFLLRFTRAPAAPAGTTGVFGNSSDLFRRVTMLLQSPLKLEKRCPRKWSLATAGLLGGLALLISGVGLRAEVASSPADPVKPPPQANPVDKKDQPAPPASPAPGTPAAYAERIQQQQQMMRGYQGMMNPYGFNRHESRLGVQVQTPNETLADQMDLPKGQGIVVVSVVPDSAAAKAGIKPHDILLELDGKSVPSDPMKLVQMIQELKADTALSAVVLRKGKKETIKGVSLPEAKVARRIFPPGQNFNQAFAPPAPLAPNPGFNQPFGAPGGLAAPNPGQPFGGPGNLGRGFGFGAAGPRTVLTTTIREDDHFTTRYQEGSLIITLTGTVADGKAKLNKIQVQDGSVAHGYESTAKVPEEYRDKVKNLVQMSERSNIKMEIETPPESKPQPSKREE
jgi:beta-lactamase regulating signal transducer with metallopeptidase domain